MATSAVGIITQLSAVNDALRLADRQFGHDTDHMVTSFSLLFGPSPTEGSWQFIVWPL